MHLITYLDLLQTTERTLASSFQLVSAGHAADADVHWATARFGRQCTEHAEVLAQTRARSAEPSEPAPERLHAQGLSAVRSGPVGLLRDLQDLHQLTALVNITWELIGQAAHAVRDRGLIHTVEHYAPETRAQLAWLRMQMKSAAPQTLVVAQ